MDEADEHARSIEPHGLLDGIGDDAAEKRGGQRTSVDISDIGADEVRGPVFAGDGLQQRGLAEGKLERIGCGIGECAHGAVGILDAGPGGDGETAVRCGVEEAVEAEGFHRARGACGSAALIATTQRTR